MSFKIEELPNSPKVRVFFNLQYQRVLLPFLLLSLLALLALADLLLGETLTHNADIEYIRIIRLYQPVLSVDLHCQLRVIRYRRVKSGFHSNVLDYIVVAHRFEALGELKKGLLC